MTSTSLIGREQDIAEVLKLLETPEVRLVTLTGPGGIGKTRLAIAVAERLDERYPRGAVFVPLASVAEPELVLPRIAAALGATIEGTRPPLDVLVEHVAETPTLLVLDNLEQVVSVAPELDQLLARCPGLADPGDEPHRAAAAGRARVSGRPADGAVVLGGLRRSSSSARCRPCSCSSIEPRPCATTSR